MKPWNSHNERYRIATTLERYRIATTLRRSIVSSQLSWEPPSAFSLDEVLHLDHQVASMLERPVQVREDIFRISDLEMDWDIGVVIYEPMEPNKIPTGPDGKKIGIFLLHGGVSDFKSVK